MRIEDAAYLAAYQSEPAYLLHYSEPPNAVAIVQSAMDWAQQHPRSSYQFAIVRRSLEDVVGCAGIRQEGYPHGEAEIGVEISPKEWRQGFATEVLNALMEFGDSTLSLSSYWALTAPSNEPAQMLIDRFGFKFHGRDRGSLRFVCKGDCITA